MNEVRIVRVAVETVTPLLLHGADPKGSPELRPPALRGTMRYWLRAALGGAIGDKDLDALRKLEQAVFGSADYGSPIVVQIHPDNHEMKKESASILPHKKQGSSQAWAAGQRIEIILRQPRRADPPVWDMAQASLALTLAFGGVGLRSRRGYGTLRVAGSSSPLLAPAPRTLDGWKSYCEQVATQALAAARKLAAAYDTSVASLPKGPSTYPCATQMGIVRLADLKAKSAMDAVIAFMRKTTANTPSLGRIRPRQASPLWVRPIQTGETYGLLFVVLASQFDGGNYGFVRQFLHDSFAGEDIAIQGWNL